MRYLIYTDVHFSKTSSIIRTIGEKYTTRLENCIKSVSWAEDYANSNMVDHIICLGDFFESPNLSSEELTALKEIKWSTLPHTFIVGNHDASNKDLSFNSINALRNLHFTILEKPVVRATNNSKVSLLYIPYFQDDVRKSIADYRTDLKIPNDNKLIVLSHNDVHCQYGMYKNDSGFEINDIENNCTLFLNGHVHNTYHFCSNGFNVGNLTGQNFNEEAANYSHNIFILDIDDNTGEIGLNMVENPYAFNFYHLTMNNENDLKLLNNLKENALVTIKCSCELIESIKLKVKTLPNIIITPVITALKPLEGNRADITLTSFNKINHLDELEKFTINQLGDTEKIRKELNKIRNN